MAGTATMTTTTGGANARYMKVHSIALTSTAGGAVSGNPQAIAGRLVQFKIKPDGGGTQPTDAFDLTLLDQDGVDLLAGAGLNWVNTATEIRVSDPAPYLVGTVDPVLANAGASKGVTLTLYVTAY